MSTFKVKRNTGYTVMSVSGKRKMANVLSLRENTINEVYLSHNKNPNPIPFGTGFGLFLFGASSVIGFLESVKKSL